MIRVTLPFAPFQCWLQLVVFHLKGDFLSNVVLILIILNISLWVLYYTVKLWHAHFWTTLGWYLTCFQRKYYLLHLYEFVIWKWLKCTENWTGSPLLHLLPPSDLALWKVANIRSFCTLTRSLSDIAWHHSQVFEMKARKPDHDITQCLQGLWSVQSDLLWQFTIHSKLKCHWLSFSYSLLLYVSSTCTTVYVYFIE